MEQQSFDDYTSAVDENEIAIRHDATDTARKAQQEVYPKTGSRKLAVFERIASAYPDGWTADELLQLFPELTSPNQVAPSVTHLRKGGWIEDSGIRRLTRYNKDAIVWTLSDKGIDESLRRGIALPRED